MSRRSYVTQRCRTSRQGFRHRFLVRYQYGTEMSRPRVSQCTPTDTFEVWELIHYYSNYREMQRFLKAENLGQTLLPTIITRLPDYNDCIISVHSERNTKLIQALDYTGMSPMPHMIEDVYLTLFQSDMMSGSRTMRWLTLDLPKHHLTRSSSEIRMATGL